MALTKEKKLELFEERRYLEIDLTCVDNVDYSNYFNQAEFVRNSVLSSINNRINEIDKLLGL